MTYDPLIVQDTRLGVVCLLASLLVPWLAGSASGAEGKAGAGAPGAVSPAPRLEATVDPRSGFFVENVGQWPRAVRHRAIAGPLVVWVTEQGLRIDARESLTCEEGGRAFTDPTRAQRPAPSIHARGVRLALDWAPAGRPASRQELQDAEGRSPLYYLPHGRAAYGKRLLLRGVAPGTDLLLSIQDGGLFYELRSEPGRAPGELEFLVRGAEGLAIAPTGELEIHTARGVLRHAAPLAWERGADAEPEEGPAESATAEPQTVPARFELVAPDRFRLRVERRDPRRGVTVDPGLEWSTYLGNEDLELATGLALASGGELVTSGSTLGANFPTTLGSYDEQFSGNLDVFVCRFDAAGSDLLWSTFIGGTDYDLGRGLALDGERPVVVGETYSTNFPTTTAAYDTAIGGIGDGFCLRLAADGSALEFSTFIGGSSIDRIIDVDVVEKRILLGGSTISHDYPTAGQPLQSSTGGFLDAVFSVLSPDGATLTYSTYFGASGDEVILDLQGGADSTVTFAGLTTSGGFPTSVGVVGNFAWGAQEGFVTRLSPGFSSVDFSTLVSGLGDDEVLGIQVQRDGSTLVVGSTDSTNFPVTTGAFSETLAGGKDGFCAHLEADGSSYRFATLVGGTVDDGLEHVALDSHGDVVVVGWTDGDFPVQPGAFDTIFGTVYPLTGPDVVFARLGPSGATLDYASLLGGSAEEHAYDFFLDASDNLWIAGQTFSHIYPVTDGAYDLVYDLALLSDAFLTRIDMDPYPFAYGTPKTHSLGGEPRVSFDGFPSVSGQMTLRLTGALPEAPAWGFFGPNAIAQPFFGGTLLVGSPARRIGPLQLTPFGNAFIDLEMDRTLIGTTQHFQFWFRDVGDVWGVGLSDALQVTFYP